MEAQDADNVTVAGEGTETYGSMKAPESKPGPRTAEALADVAPRARQARVDERRSEPVAEGQIAAGLVSVPERVPGPIAPESQVPDEPTREEELEEIQDQPRPDHTLPGDLPGGEEGADPVLTSLEPAELSVAAPDTTVLFKGTGFTEESKIIWNGGEEVTNFGDPTTLSTVVKPSTVDPGLPLPFSLPVSVRTGEKETAELQFTFVAAGENPVVDNTLPPEGGSQTAAQGGPYPDQTKPQDITAAEKQMAERESGGPPPAGGGEGQSVATKTGTAKPAPTSSSNQG